MLTDFNSVEPEVVLDEPCEQLAPVLAGLLGEEQVGVSKPTGTLDLPDAADPVPRAVELDSALPEPPSPNIWLIISLATSDAYILSIGPVKS